MPKLFRDIPIKHKVRLIIVGASMVTLLLASFSLLVFQWFNARATIQRTLAVQAEIIAANCTAALTFDDKKAGNEVLAALKAQPYILSASLYRADQQLFAHYGAEADKDEPPPNSWVMGFRYEGSRLVLLRPVMFNQKSIGTLYWIFDSRAMEREIILPFVIILGGSILTALLAAIAVSSIFQRVITAPILQLTSTARLVAENKDYAVRARAQSADELGTLTQTFNQMLVRIQEQDSALRDSEGRYRLLFESNPLPMFVYVEATSVILAVNEAALRHYGYSLPELKVMKFSELAASDQTETDVHAAARAKSPVTAAYQIRHRKRDGTTIEVDVTSHLIEFSSQPARLALCLDITARKLAEGRLALAFEELNQAKLAADAASLSKSRFLAVMSHEIRTPLNGVTGMLKLLLGGNLSSRQRRWADMAQTSADTLLNVINDILDFSKVEAGKLDLHLQPIQLHATIQKTACIFAHRSASKALAWDLHIDPAVPPWVEADANWLTQVLVNLLGNAVKFTDAGSVRLCATLKSATADSATVRFEVTDTGVGLSPEQQGCLFKPFSQLDNSTTRRHGGTGLGLGICKQLVELMGGTIGVASAVGNGSTFWFELPFKLAMTVANQMPDAKAGNADSPVLVPKAESGRILLAEDNEINQELAREIIVFAGYECDCVENGQKAVCAVRAGGYDLVFMDCMMPRMDGYTAAQTIRAQEAKPAATGPAARRLPIIAMTANAMEGDRDECLAAGMDDYLSKPLDPEKVAQMIRKWMPAAPPDSLSARDGSHRTPVNSGRLDSTREQSR